MPTTIGHIVRPHLLIERRTFGRAEYPQSSGGVVSLGLETLGLASLMEGVLSW